MTSENVPFFSSAKVLYFFKSPIILLNIFPDLYPFLSDRYKTLYENPPFLNVS